MKFCFHLDLKLKEKNQMVGQMRTIIRT